MPCYTYPISFATGVEFDLLYVSRGIYFPGCPQGEGKKKFEKEKKKVKKAVKKL